MAVGFCRSCGNPAERMCCVTCEVARQQYRQPERPPRCGSCGMPVAAIYRICYRCSSRTHRTAGQHRRYR